MVHSARTTQDSVALDANKIKLVGRASVPAGKYGVAPHKSIFVAERVRLW
jgi:hypothetical protein